MDAVGKKKEKLDGKEVTATCSVVKTVGLTKPPRPVWTLTVDELDSYFTTLKSEIVKQEGVKLRPKWPKIVNNVTVTAPTPIPSFDDVLKRILPYVSINDVEEKFSSCINSSVRHRGLT